MKSRVRNPAAATYGTYGLVDPNLNTWIAGDFNNGFGMTLDEIEIALTDRVGDAR